jgi:DNA-binding NarL/FixJ family response regulator
MNPIRVFLADDHAMVREGLASLLAGSPEFEVVGQCGNGLEVMSKILKCMPDVVVLDIIMPGLNGLDICREIGRKAPAASVLILSVHDNEQFIVRALEYGAAGYLLKESAAEQLAEALRAVAHGRRYLGPGIKADVLDRAAGTDHDPYDLLSTRERQVLQLIAEGRTNRKIADDLGLSVKTVDTHRMRLMRKLNIHDQTTLVKFAIRKGMVSLD